MVVVMDGQTSDADVEKLADKLESLGFDIQKIIGERRIVLAIIGDNCSCYYWRYKKFRFFPFLRLYRGEGSSSSCKTL